MHRPGHSVQAWRFDYKVQYVREAALRVRVRRYVKSNAPVIDSLIHI